jgi:uncharacterized damage-inducible protein DinB
MNWTGLLKSRVASVYHATEGLLDLVDDSMLGFKPATGENWMTMGQLILHLTDACGFCCRGFVTGQWVREGDGAAAEPAEMLPPAEKLPAAESVEQARALLAEDKALAYRMIEEVGEDDLDAKRVAAPWNPEVTAPLGQHFLDMVTHLSQHKGQLFYYLKLMGKPVHTGHLWGM